MKGVMDMTHGRPLRLMLRFAFPILISSVLQQVYTLSDGLIVGRFLGIKAFAAVSAAGFIAWLPQNMMLGLTHGFGIVLSRLFGAGDARGFKRANLLAAVFSGAAAVLFSALLILYLDRVLEILRLPVELRAFASDYLRVIYFGLIFFALFNWTAAALRAVGDSRTPLIALVVSSTINIAFDYVLVKVIPMGVIGPALSTTIGQAAAFLYCITVFLLKKMEFPVKSNVRIGAGIKTLLYMGIPPMLRDGVIAVGGLCVQWVINGYKTDFVGGMAAASRYFAMISMAGGCLEGAVATFSSQNFGAGQMERIRTGVQKAVRFSLVTAAVTMAVSWLIAPMLIALITGTGETEMFTAGVFALRYSILFLPFLHLLFIFRPAVQSMGSSVTPMLSGFFELGMRILSVFCLTAYIGRTSAYIADGLGWVMASVLLWIRYRMLMKKIGKYEEKTSETAN